ncbi:MAG: prolyl oligopeptidase family serine peptidase [Bacteroidota bacterium]
MRPKSQWKFNCLVMVLFLCASLLSSESVLSQVNKLDDKNLEETMRNPWKPDRSVFLQDWLVLGSIPISGIGDIDKDFLVDYNGEANIRPVEGQAMKISGTELKWVRTKAKDIVDLRKLFQGGRTENAVAYAYTTIKRKEAGRVYFSLGSDDGVKIWLNGKLIHRVLIQRALTLDEDGVGSDAIAGENHLLLKIQQGNGDWGFAVRMSDNPNELTVITGDINFSLAPGAPNENTLAVSSQGNLNQALLKQTVQMEVYTTGGKTVATKTLNCGDPVVLSYKDWPDGVYEFRFKYDDIHGTPALKYITWYKGDILAAAREIVNSAPDKDVRTPEAATHRMLADMILNRLGNNIQNPDSSRLSALHSPLMEFTEIKANKQVHAGGFVRLAYIDDIDNTPQFCRSYLPLNYDPAKKWPLVVYLHGYNGDNPEYYNWWSADKRHDGASDKHDVIFIEPHGRGNTQYLGIGDRDVLKCIEMAKQKFNVDEDRVYLMGSSMGGFGTWNVATRHPELFAAINPIYGGSDYHVFLSKENAAKMTSWEAFLNDKSSSTAQLEALVNMPILVTHGDQDQSVNVNLSRYIVRLLQRWNYDVRYIEVPGKGHTELGLWDQTISWLLQHKRNADPRQVRVRAADLRAASAYWVKVTQKSNPFEFAVVDAEALEGNIIRVDSKNAGELILTPGEPLIDYSKPVTVVWNGKTISVDNPQEKRIVLREEDYRPPSLFKTPHLAGPLADFQNTPFIIVIGTTSNDSLMKKVIRQKAETLTSDWKASQKYEPRVKNDVEVTEADMKNCSLFLLGGPEDNVISKQVFDKTPFQVRSDEILLDGRSLIAKDAVLYAVYPNPFNSERYLGVVAATSWPGFYFFDSRQRDPLEYDFCITDGKLPNFSVGAKNEKILVASGFFNHDWKIDDALLKKGDDELRSKCAYTVVNNDLTTKIVSSAQPSIELLKSYVGTYQIENGPQITVFLDKDTLRAAQGPNNQFSVKPLAVSDNEFFVKEVNASISFVKDQATNDYVMIVYQSGGEFTSKKVK